MGVNEFIEQFTQSEVEKIERKDVRDRIRNKLSVQKISHVKSIASLEQNSMRES